MAKAKTVGLSIKIVVVLFFLIGMVIYSGHMVVTKAVELDEKGNIVGADQVLYYSSNRVFRFERFNIQPAW